MIRTLTPMFKGRNVPAAGAIATAVLVLLFGNPPFVEWIRNPSNVNPNGLIGFLLNQLTWPEWQFAPKDDSSGATRDMLANDLRALLIIVFVFGILAMVAKGIGSGGVGFIVGWVSLILGAALAAFLTYFLKVDASLSGPNSALVALQSGGSYGLFVGWLVGIATATAKKA
jgi:hypothetical protein